MKMHKKHKLAVAICLAFGVGSVQAAISNGAPSTQAGGSGVAGELFLSVWDQLAQTSYALDLGVLVTDMVANQNTSHVWNLDQRFTNWAAQTNDPLIFNVAGENGYVTRTSVNDDLLLSSRTGYNNTINVNMGASGILKVQNAVSARANSINTAAGEPLGTNFAANNSEVTTNITDSAYFTQQWGIGESVPNYVGSAIVRNGSIADQTVDLFNIHSPGGNNVLASTQAIVDKLNGTLALNVAAGTLTWSTNYISPVTAVPLPGAVWLFLGGLMTTLKLQKRRVSGLAA